MLRDCDDGVLYDLDVVATVDAGGSAVLLSAVVFVTVSALTSLEVPATFVFDVRTEDEIWWTHEAESALTDVLELCTTLTVAVFGSTPVVAAVALPSSIGRK